MHVLVTGGAGYIGGHTVAALLRAGHEVVVLDNLSTGRATQLPEGAQLVVGDAGDADVVRRILAGGDIDAVLHFAAFIRVEESVSNPLAYYRNNVALSVTLIDEAVKAGVKHFIFSSSAAVYGNPVLSPVPEDAVRAPVSPYGHSKAMVEQVLSDAARAHGMRYVSLRYFNVAGADPDRGLRKPYRVEGQPSHLIKAAIAAALGRKSHFELYGTDYPTRDGTCLRDFIHVCDLAEAHVEALQYLQNGGDSAVLNCGYGKGCSVLEVVEAVKRVSGRDFPVRLASRRSGDVAVVVADTRRIKTVLPEWKPRFEDLELMVRHQYEFEKSEHNQPVE